MDVPQLSLETVRDEFAARAMQGFLSFAGPDVTVHWDTLAEMAYDLAEAMMEERAKRMR